MKKEADAYAADLVALLKEQRRKLVLAESCTGGELAAALTRIPGVSEHLCGSLVVYRDEQKRKWLGVKASTLRKHTAVSAPCAKEMHRGALTVTKEADLAIAVTGYLGPGNANDGLVYLTYGTKKHSRTVKLWVLRNAPSDRSLRERRRQVLVRKVLLDVIAFLKKTG